jgi:hypothetical protein
VQILKKLFLLWHFSRESCDNFEFPLELSNTTYSKYVNGQFLSVRNSVSTEFQFDENLKGYSWMEDFLFTASINKKHPKSLLIAPDAMYTHTERARGIETKPRGKTSLTRGDETENTFKYNCGVRKAC